MFDDHTLVKPGGVYAVLIAACPALVIDKYMAEAPSWKRPTAGVCSTQSLNTFPSGRSECYPGVMLRGPATTLMSATY